MNYEMIDKLKSIINIYFILFVIGIGLFVLVYDVRILKIRNLKKESKLIKGIAIFIIVAAPLSYLMIRYIGRM